MILKVRLSNLDRKDIIFYPNEVEVAIYNDDSYNIIGTCSVYQDEQKRHFGELKLQTNINTDLYFYYRARANDGGIYMFAGIDLMENEQPNQPTVRLSELISQ